MASRQLCPWCDTEIVWDEEFGPEETCPHCHNELSDYKSVTLELEEETSTIDDVGEIAEAYSDEAARGADCSYCGEETIIVGQQRMPANEFVPRQSTQLNMPLLQAPFTMDVAMCPSCSQLFFSLSEESRQQMERRWQGN